MQYIFILKQKLLNKTSLKCEFASSSFVSHQVILDYYVKLYYSCIYYYLYTVKLPLGFFNMSPLI